MTHPRVKNNGEGSHNLAEKSGNARNGQRVKLWKVGRVRLLTYRQRPLVKECGVSLWLYGQEHERRLTDYEDRHRGLGRTG